MMWHECAPEKLCFVRKESIAAKKFPFTSLEITIMI